MNQIFLNLTGNKAGSSSSYDDLWRLTLVNYNAGPGCLTEALRTAIRANQMLDWPHVSGNLAGVCASAVDYVAHIAQ